MFWIRKKYILTQIFFESFQSYFLSPVACTIKVLRS